jgi:hypothetical protein
MTCASAAAAAASLPQFVHRFWAAVRSRTSRNELDLEGLEEGSPLEMCYLLGEWKAFFKGIDFTYVPSRVVLVLPLTPCSASTSCLQQWCRHAAGG